MKNRRTLRRLLLIAATVCMLMPRAGSAVSTRVQRQDDDDEIRKIWDEGLIQKRQSSGGRRGNYRFRRASPALPRQPRAGGRRRRPVAATQDSVLGVTIWRLRPSNASDEVREFVHTRPQGQTGGESVGLTAERVEAGTPLGVDERVRISIEAPRTGYLYVVNREKYADGSSGPPRLIFPTGRTLDGNNRVRPGRLITIPAHADDPPYFTVRPNPRRRDQVAELLIIIVADSPLNLPPAADAVTLPAALVDGWQRAWGTDFERFEQEGGAGAAITTRESAGTDDRRELTQDDPVPQTIFNVRSRLGKPLLINLALPFKR